MHSVVIVDVGRTPSGKGKPGGALSATHPVELLATALRELLSRNDIDPAQVGDVIAGCVGQNGEQALNIARSAVLAGPAILELATTTVAVRPGQQLIIDDFGNYQISAG